MEHTYTIENRDFVRALENNDPNLTSSDQARLLNEDEDRATALFNQTTKIFQAIENNTALRILKIELIYDVDDATAIHNMIKNNTGLVTLSLSGGALNENLVGPIVKALQFNTTLISLDISNGVYKDDDLSNIAKAICSNDIHLKKLKLDYWNSPGCNHNDLLNNFVDAIKHNYFLEELVFEIDAYLKNLTNGSDDENEENNYFVDMERSSFRKNYSSFEKNVKKYLARNKRAHQKAKDAVITLLAIANRRFRDPHKLHMTPTDEQLSNMITAMQDDIIKEQAQYLWSTRFEPVWWTREERQEIIGLPEYVPSNLTWWEKKAATTNACIQCIGQEARFVEQSNKKRLFCGAYCQFLHHNPALPDLRGMSVEQIKECLL